MLSYLMNLTTPYKINKDISLFLFDTKENNQNIVIKGKLGQTQILWKNIKSFGKSKWIVKNLDNKYRSHFVLDRESISDVKYTSNIKSNFEKWPKLDSKSNNSHESFLSLSHGLKTEDFISNHEINHKSSRGSILIHYLKLYIKGVIQGYTMNLKLSGMGFHANYSKMNWFKVDKKDKENKFRFGHLENLKGSSDSKSMKELLSFYLGKSHNLMYEIPLKSVKISEDLLKKTGIISISGINLEYTSQIASIIQNYRKPDPYKGKGISFEDFTFISKKEQKK